MNDPEIHRQQQRENPEPQEGSNPMPWFVVLLTAVLLGFGIVYISTTSISEEPSYGDGRTVAELQGAAPTAHENAVDGKAVYASHCAACHQASGAGLMGVFPPLAGSEWVAGKGSTLANIVLHGIDGALTVKGKTYNGVMPAFKDQLGDPEIAALLTHIRSQWGNQGAAVETETVAQVRKDSQARTGPFKGDAELASMR